MTGLEVTTCVILAAVVVGLSLWDIYAKMKQPNGNATISWQLRILAQKWPIIAFMAGVLAGHFWFFNCGSQPLQCVAAQVSGKTVYLVEPKETCTIPVTSTLSTEQQIHLPIK